MAAQKADTPGQSQYSDTANQYDTSDKVTIYRPGPFQKELSRFVVFIIKWQDLFWAILLLPVLLGTAAVAFGRWEIGGGFIAFAGLSAVVILMLVIAVQLFNRVGINLD